MPAFLDFCFEIEPKTKAAPSSMFRLDDTLQPDGEVSPNLQLGLKRLSGRIQHTFNLMRFEPSSNADWQLRRITSFHSFDFVDGVSLWLNIQEADSVHDLEFCYPELYLDRASQNPSRRDIMINDFRASLSAHIHILGWCTKTWTPFIQYLADKAHIPLTAIRNTPVETLSSNSRPMWRVHGSLVKDHAAAETSPAWASDIHVEGKHRGSLRSNRELESLTQEPMIPRTVWDWDEKIKRIDKDHESIDATFIFDDISAVRRVVDETEQAIAIIGENQKILRTVSERYVNLMKSSRLQLLDGCDSLEPDITGFCEQINILQGDLESYKARLSNLRRSLARSEEMVIICLPDPVFISIRVTNYLPIT